MTTAENATQPADEIETATREKKRDNKVVLESDAIERIEYVQGSLHITEGQPWDLPLDIRRDGNRWTLTLRCGRQGSSEVANEFCKRCGGPSHAFAPTSNAELPKALNFLFGIKLRLRLGGRIHEETIHLAQGHKGLMNNWWIGGQNLVKMVNDSHAILVIAPPGPDVLEEIFSVSGGTNEFALTLWSEENTPESAYSTAMEPESWIKVRAANWMKRIPDEVRLSDITIPGTHDSGARRSRLPGGWLIVTKTQSWSIGDQLEAGIRYLDIRVRRMRNGRFAIYHGPFSQDLDLTEGVLDPVRAFLEKSPTETVLMRVKEETGPESGARSFSTMWDRHMRGRHAHLYMPYSNDRGVPQLGQVRGKIVFLRDGGDFPGIRDQRGTMEYGIHWNSQIIQDSWYVWFFQHEMGEPGSPDVSLPTKKRFVREHIEKAWQRNTGSWQLVINHLSGAGAMAPWDVAKRLNNATFSDYLPRPPGDGNHPLKRGRGLLIMDFPGEGLLDRIVRLNFR